MMGVGSLLWPMAQGSPDFKAVSDTITFTDSAIASNSGQSGSDSLSLTQSVSYQAIFNPSLIDNIIISDLLTLQFISSILVSDTIAFIQDAEGRDSVSYESYSDVLQGQSENTEISSYSYLISNFFEIVLRDFYSTTVAGQAESIAIESYSGLLAFDDTFQSIIQLVDQVGAALNNNQIIGDSLNFEDAAQESVFPNISDSLNLIDRASQYITQTDIFDTNVTDSTLIFSDLASASITGRPVSNSIVFSDSVALSLIYNPSIHDTLWPGDKTDPVSELGPIFFRTSGPQTSSVDGDVLTSLGPEYIPLYDGSVGTVDPEVLDTLDLEDSAIPNIVQNVSRVQNLYPTDTAISLVAHFFNVNASSTITLSDNLTLSRVFHATDVITISDSLILSQTKHASDILVLSDLASVEVYHAVTQTLNLTDSFSLNIVLTLPETDVITFTDLAARSFPESLSDSFVLSDSNLNDVSHLSTDSITLTDSSTALIEYTVSVAQGLNFTDVATVYSSAFYDVLALTDSAVLTVTFNITDTISFVGQVLIIQIEAVSSTLALIESVDVLKNTPAYDVIPITDSFILIQNLNFTEEDYLEIQHSALGYLNKNPSPCSEICVGSRDRITLTFPYSLPTLTLDLRPPKFGNSTTVTSRPINRRTRGGQLKVSRPSSWAQIQVLKMAFEGMDEATINTFLDFLKTSSGHEIGLLDHEGRQWRGVMTPAEITTTQLTRDCNFGTEFEFRGALV